MKNTFIYTILMALIFSQAVSAAKLQVKFAATTNMPGVSIDGELKSSQVINLDSKEKQVLPISLFDTGMEVRDEHMREMVFKGKDISYKISKKECKESKCNVTVAFDINGVSVDKSFSAVKSDKTTKGKFSLLLSEFKVEQPSKFGVTVEDKVEVEFNITE